MRRRPMPRISLLVILVGSMAMMSCTPVSGPPNAASAPSTESPSPASPVDAVATPSTPVASATGATTPSQTMASGSGSAWSDPASWGGTVPAAGAFAEIPPGKIVILDVVTPALAGLTIKGTLIAQQGATIGVTAGHVYVAQGGTLQVGTPSEPFTGVATFTLTGDAGDPGIAGMGSKVLAVENGVLDLHGATVTDSWTKLGADVAAGATTVDLATAPGWRVGDRIVIAPSTPDQMTHDVATVAAIDGPRVTLSEPLKHPHFGTVQQAGDVSLDVRAEVGLLSRNIVITGDDSSDSARFGAQTMFMGASTIRISGAEITKAGQFNVAGRYPLHFHMMGNQCADCSITNTSVHDTVQRGIVLHDTQGIVLDENVVFNTVGHNIVVETEGTTGNTVTNNLALVNREPVPAFTEETLVTQQDQLPANYWMKSGLNTVSRNVAAGSQASGFIYDLIAADGPLAFTDNAVHAAMSQPSQVREGDFDVSAGFLVAGGGGGEETTPPRRRSADDVMTGLLAYQNTTGIWPEEDGPFRIGDFIVADNAVQVQNRGDDINVYTNGTWVNRLPRGSTTPDIVTDDDGGSMPPNNVVSHSQYGSFVTIDSPHFVGYTEIALVANDIAPRTASFTVSDVSYGPGPRPSWSFPENTATTVILTDASSGYAAGSYRATNP